MNEQRNIRKTVVAAVMLSLLSIAAAAGIVCVVTGLIAGAKK